MPGDCSKTRFGNGVVPIVSSLARVVASLNCGCPAGAPA
jgi:hypothetical protein